MLFVGVIQKLQTHATWHATASWTLLNINGKKTRRLAHVPSGIFGGLQLIYLLFQTITTGDTSPPAKATADPWAVLLLFFFFYLPGLK